MRGRIIKTSTKDWIFVQLDKNGQICDFFRFDRSKPKEERIGERIRGELFNTYKGRPLYTAWNDLVDEVTKED